MSQYVDWFHTTRRKHLNFSPSFNFSCTLRRCQVGNNGRCHNPPLGVSTVLDQTPHSWCNSRAAAGHALSSPQFFFFSLFSPPLSRRIQSVFSFSRQLLCTTNNQSFAPAPFSRFTLRFLFCFKKTKQSLPDMSTGYVYFVQPK